MIEYVKGTTKGASEEGELTNGVYKLGDVDQTYTGDAIVEPVDTFTSGTTKVAFTPVVEGSVKLLDADGVDLEATAISVADDGTVTATVSGTVKKIAYKYDNIVIPQKTLPTLKAELKNIGLEAHARRIAVKRYAA